jgi:hypothetical protein
MREKSACQDFWQIAKNLGKNFFLTRFFFFCQDFWQIAKNLGKNTFSAFF